MIRAGDDAVGAPPAAQQRSELRSGADDPAPVTMQSEAMLRSGADDYRAARRQHRFG